MYVIMGSGFPFMVTGPRFLNTKLSCGWHSRDLQIEKDATDKDAKIIQKRMILQSWYFFLLAHLSLQSRCNMGEGGGGVGGGWVAGVEMEGGICSFPILPLLFNPPPFLIPSHFTPLTTRDNKTMINRGQAARTE